MESLGAYVALSSAATGLLLVSGLLENVRITAPALSRNASITSPWGAGAGAGAGLSFRQYVTATPGKGFSPVAGRSARPPADRPAGSGVEGRALGPLAPSAACGSGEGASGPPEARP